MNRSFLMYCAGIAFFLAFSLGPGSYPRGFSAETRPSKTVSDRPRFDAEYAMQLIREQLGFGSRSLARPGHEAAKAFLEEKLRESSDGVVRQPFRWQGYDLTNFIAWICRQPPPPPEKNERLAKGGSPCSGGRPPVLLSTHWDTHPYATRDQDRSRRRLPVPGANDGGSGTAVLLALGRGMMKARPPRDVIIVLFDGEDYGIGDEWIIGSRHFARNLPEPRPAFGINLDMVGDRDLNIHVEGDSKRRAPRIVQKILEAAQRVGARSFHPDVKHHLLDDHVPLNDAGVPTANVIDFDYPHWHTSRDTLDKVSPRSLKEVARVVIEVLYGGN